MNVLLLIVFLVLVSGPFLKFCRPWQLGLILILVVVLPVLSGPFRQITLMILCVTVQRNSLVLLTVFRHLMITVRLLRRLVILFWSSVVTLIQRQWVRPTSENDPFIGKKLFMMM